MLAMQYSIRLTATDDVQKIRDRVQDRGKLYDPLDGLVMKSFLLNEAEMNYAPFYVWKTEDDWRHFVFSELFADIRRTFGRPRVRTWFVLHFSHGDPTVKPGLAKREVDAVAEEEIMTDLLAREGDRHLKALDDEGLHSHVVALDADRWELVRYSLWRDRDALDAARRDGESDCVNTYEVLHLSEPGRQAPFTHGA